jgi:hypothetical protein
MRTRQEDFNGYDRRPLRSAALQRYKELLTSSLAAFRFSFQYVIARTPLGLSAAIILRCYAF